MACPGDCKSCCYEIKVLIEYLSGVCPAGYSCNNYNGWWTLTQTGGTGTDCEWIYTDPADGFTITIDCDSGYWWLKITHDGFNAARWRVAQTGNYVDCPPVGGANWNYVDGICTGMTWARTSCVTYERPIFPPEWYPEILMNVMRMRLKWD